MNEGVCGGVGAFHSVPPSTIPHHVPPPVCAIPSHSIYTPPLPSPSPPYHSVASGGISFTQVGACM
jgi:hypothetical protein